MDFTRKLIKKRSRTLIRPNMDMMLEAYLTHESRNLDTEDIPRTKEPVWILGKQYNAINGEWNLILASKIVHYAYIIILSELLLVDKVARCQILDSDIYRSRL